MTTLFYSNHLFGKAEARLRELAKRPYDFTILCAPDFSFIQDGTRQPESFRLLQHEWYLKELANGRMAYELVAGSVDARISHVRRLLSVCC